MRLRQVLTADDAPNHVVGLPLPLKITGNLRPSSREFWDYFTLRKGGALRGLLSCKRTYVDTQLSRFYIIYSDKANSKRQLQLLRQIWNDRDIVIVEGCAEPDGNRQRSLRQRTQYRAGHRLCHGCLLALR